jgi:GAF domain-containing protein
VIDRPGSDPQYLEALVRVGEIIGRSLDFDETMDNVCQAAVLTMADLCVLNVRSMGREDERIATAASARVASHADAIREITTFRRRDAGKPEHRRHQVLRSGEPFLISQLDDAAIADIATSERHERFMRELEYRSILIVPVVSQVSGVFGTLTLIRTGLHAPPFERDALLFAGDFGRRSGSALSKAELFTRSVDVANQFQRAALPRSLPAVPGVTLDSIYEPADTELLVGGDWYDAFELPDGRIGISIGDVAGHGLQAAVFMGGLRDALRVLLYADPDLSRALDVADHFVQTEAPVGMHATASLSIYDPEHRTIASMSAGHPGPLVWDPTSACVIDPFFERGLPLGYRDMAEEPLIAAVISLARGAFAVYFTDGLIEAEHDHVEGVRTLEAAMLDPQVRSSPEPAREIRRRVVSGPHGDDIAILTLSVLAEEQRLTDDPRPAKS